MKRSRASSDENDVCVSDNSECNDVPSNHNLATSTYAVPVKVKTVYVRCAAMHNRGDLVNGLLYEHRDRIGMEKWYDNDGKLLPNAPLEVVYVKKSRKPYFLVEWRYSTPAEFARRRYDLDESNQHNNAKHVLSTTHQQYEQTEDDAQIQISKIAQNAGNATTLALHYKKATITQQQPRALSSITTSTEACISSDQKIDDATLEQCCEKFLTLGTHTDGHNPLMFRDTKVDVTVASTGINVQIEREKLERRDIQRAQEARNHAANDAIGNFSSKANNSSHVSMQTATAVRVVPTTATTFVPRAVRRQRT